MKKLAFLTLLLISTSVIASKADDAHQAYASGDYAKALALSLPLAEAGDGGMLGNVGNMYAFGWGTPVDEAKGVSYWMRASEKHIAAPMGNIATFYFMGKGGLPKDHSKAAEWYLKASQHGHIMSMVTLSSFYDLGLNVEKSKVKALAWAVIALSYAGTPEETAAATRQLDQTKREAAESDLVAAQNLAPELVSLIRANRQLAE